MNMIKRSQEPEKMRDTRTYDQTVHDLVTGAPDIECIWVPLLWNLA